jgi:hypothetical protein
VEVGGERRHVGGQDRPAQTKVEAQTSTSRSRAKKKAVGRVRIARVAAPHRSTTTLAGELAIPTLVDFLRSTPADLLQNYFERLQLSLEPEPVWTKKSSDLGSDLQRAIEALAASDRQRVMDDADRIGAMADDSGQAALYAVTQEHEALDLLPNGYARATWMLLHTPAALEHGEQVRYADDRRGGRMWDGFICQPDCIAAREGEALEAFKEAVKQHFDSRNAEIEMCDRWRARLGQQDARLVQASVYREGRAGARKAFVGGRLDRLPDHPVIEAAITYESDTGVIEVVAREREAREALVRLFAEHLLKTAFQGERLQIRQYTLDGLRKPFGFPTDPDDNIEGVRISLLRLIPLDTGGERVTMECMRGAQRNIWQMSQARFDQHDPLQEGYRITQARFTIKFKASPGVRGGRTLPVTISMPKGCDLKDRTERERLIGDKYLRRWNLLRDV